MTEIILYLILVAVVGLVLGLLIGRYSVKSAIQRKVHAAYLKAQDDLQADKRELAVSLNEQLFSIRESILKSAEAYEGAVRAVEQRLGVNLAGDNARLEGSSPEQLHLEFKNERKELATPHPVPPDEEPTIEEELQLSDIRDSAVPGSSPANEITHPTDEERAEQAAAVVNR